MLELAPAEHGRLERFFREHLGDAALHLPPIVFGTGAAAAWLTRRLDAAAITLGRLVLVAPRFVVRDGEGLWAPADLVVHEAAHVVQYRTQGPLWFLAGYAAAYLAALRRAGRLDAAAREAAYLAIPAERAARAAAAAYREWARGDGAADGRVSVRARA